MVKISLTGFLRDFSGYGEAARRLLAALEAVEADVSPGVILTDGGGQMNPDALLQRFLVRPPVEVPDVSLIVAAPNQFPMVRTPARKTFGYTCWETDRLHQTAIDGCKAVDEVIVPSDQNLKVFARADIDVNAVALPVLPPLEVPKLEIEGDPFVFYSVMTFQERKNPRGLLISYLTEFTDRDRVLLVLKIAGGAGLVAAHRELAALREALNLPNPPTVKLIGGRWTDRQVESLHAAGDCYVTLTRGEACGLPALDAVARGTTVIATDWGGHVDFLRDYPGAVLIPSRLTPVVQAYSYFDGTQCWADPDLLAARGAMRAAYNGFAEEGLHPMKASMDLSSRSLAAVGAQLMGVLGGD